MDLIRKVVGHIRNKVVTLQPQVREKNHVNVASLFFNRGSYLFFPALLFRTLELNLPCSENSLYYKLHTRREYSDSIMKNEYDICCFPKKWPSSSYLHFQKNRI